MKVNIIYFSFFFFFFLRFCLSALHQRPPPGGLANCHDQSQVSRDHSGTAGLLHPPYWHILGAGPPSQLVFLSSALRHQQPEQLSVERGAPVVRAHVPTFVPGAQSHPPAQ